MGDREFSEEELELGAARALQPAHPVQRPSLNAIAQAIAAEYCLPLSTVLGRSRYAHVAAARQALYCALRDHGLSLPAIGRFMQRDHTTILYGIEAHRRRAKTG